MYGKQELDAKLGLCQVCCVGGLSEARRWESVGQVNVHAYSSAEKPGLAAWPREPAGAGWSSQLGLRRVWGPRRGLG